MTGFYDNTEQLDGFIGIEKPTGRDYDKLMDIISDDVDLAVYFYKENTNPGWLDILNSGEHFKQLGDAEIANDFLLRMKAFYLVEVSKTRAKEVVRIILELDVKDWFIQSILLRALSAKPLEIVSEGLDLIKKYFSAVENVEWYTHGESSAKFMTAIAEKNPDEAFEIAAILLEIHKKEGDTYFDQIKSRFKGRDYDDILFKYYKQLWERFPFRATKLLIDVFNTYLIELGEADYNVKNGFSNIVPHLDKLEDIYSMPILKHFIHGICESGKEVTEKAPERIGDLLDYLEKLDTAIFKRIEMYLLRFVQGDGEKDRVNGIIDNEAFLKDESTYGYEYKLLLRDRFEKISDEAKETFTDWVKGEQVQEEEIGYYAEWFKERYGCDHTPGDLSRYEDSLRAGKLYLVRDKGDFKDLYKKYRDSCGKSDEELAPQSSECEVRESSPTEAAPVNADEMYGMMPIEAIEYINTSERWVIDETNWWAKMRSPEKDLSYLFENVVKEKVDDYAGLELVELKKIKPMFLARYYNGIVNVLREKNLKEDSLLQVLEKSKSIVDENIIDPNFNSTFRFVLEIIEIIFNREELKKSIVPENAKLVWNIIIKLRSYQDDMKGYSDENDAHSICINSVSGRAFGLIVRFGLFFKNLDESEYQKQWSKKFRENVKDVIDKVKERWVRCVLGVNYPQIYWLEKEFAKDNVNNIFNVEDNETWKDVWGSYLSWGRAYKNIFIYLQEAGKYKAGISKIVTSGGGRFGKQADKGLMQHIMIAYYNGWIEWEDPLLKQFHEETPAELRGKAIWFLRTGFKPTLESGKPEDIKEKAERIRQYWRARLSEIEKSDNNDNDEAIEFVSWVVDTLLEPKETLEFTLQTLELTGGKLGKNRGEVDLVKGACEIGEGNELLALQCMNIMMEGKPEWLSFSMYKSELMGFLDHVDKLSDIDGIAEIRKEAIELVNAYGRRQVDDLKSYYVKFRNQHG